MDVIKEYLISVCIAAIICGILIKLTEEKGSTGALVKLLCGLFMLITTLSPIIKLPVYEFQNFFDQLAVEAEHAASIGQTAANEEIDHIVADRTKAYILEKASALGVTLDVEVVLKDSIPATVRISGAASPYAKHLLSKYISEHLGITAEDQQWNG